MMCPQNVARTLAGTLIPLIMVLACKLVQWCKLEDSRSAKRKAIIGTFIDAGLRFSANTATGTSAQGTTYSVTRVDDVMKRCHTNELSAIRLFFP